MITLLLENTIAPPPPAILLVYVTKDCPENMRLLLWKVHIALAAVEIL